MVVKALREALPDDTRALTREEFIRADQEYFVAVKPVGLVFKVGAFVALLSGAVILFQVLSAEIASRLPEFATMKAMGLGDGFLHRLGIAQAAMYCLFGYIVAIFVSWGLFHLVRALSRLPMEITPVLVLQVAAMVAVLCGVSCALALRRVRRADPADLF
jgi:putative ABC transport system permease protein